jgi:hypothetical protein
MIDFGNERVTTRRNILGYVIQNAQDDPINTVPAQVFSDKVIPGNLTSVNNSVSSIIPAMDTETDKAVEDASTANMSVAEKNMLLRAKYKIGAAKNGQAHLTPGGVPCENPIISTEKLSSGGFLKICDTCGATLQDSDLVTND